MAQYQRAPYDEIRMTRVAAAGADPASDPNTRRTFPVGTAGGGFAITVSHTAPLTNTLKLQVNNSRYIDPTQAHHAVNPVYNFNTDKAVLDVIYPPNAEPTVIDPEFNNNWINLTDAAGGITDGVLAGGGESDVTFASRHPYRWLRIVETAAAPAEIPVDIKIYVNLAV